MSSTIWTQCAGKSRLRALTCQAWRLVEDQSRVATRKLVDSDVEQERLEEMIEAAKPPIPRGPTWQHLHYLLFTPFRYPPLHHGSRFRTRVEPGVWYGSLGIETALAEVAYWRLRFLNDTAAEISSELFLTAFTIPVHSPKGIDLTRAPFASFAGRISSKTSYADSQPLGSAMRTDGVEVCLYLSARDPGQGKNAAVFSPTAFSKKTVSDASQERWYCWAARNRVEFHWQSFTQAKSLAFTAKDFEVDGKLPLMA